MSKVIVLKRYFENSDAQLEMHYSGCLNSATIKYRAGKIKTRQWYWNFKTECDYETFEKFFNKYCLKDEIKTTELIEDLDKLLETEEE